MTTFAEEWDSPEGIDRKIGTLPMKDVDKALRHTLGLKAEPPKRK